MLLRTSRLAIGGLGVNARTCSRSAAAVAELTLGFALEITLAVFTGLLARAFGGMHDPDRIFLVRFAGGGAVERIGEAVGNIARHLEEGFCLADADRANLVAGDVTAAADQRQQPARIGILAAADVHLEPDRILEARAVAFLLSGAARIGRVLDQVFGLRHLGAVGMDQRGGDVGGRLLLQQARRQFAVFILDLDGCHQRFQQAFAVLLADFPGGGRVAPFGIDPRRTQHAFHAAAARIGNDQDSGALLARPAGASRTVLQSFGVARHFDMDHEAEAGQVDAASSHVGRHADAGAAVAQGLHRLVALALRMFARQGHYGEPAFLQSSVQPPHIVAGGAEQHGGFGFVITQQVHHRVLHFGRGDGDSLVLDVAVTAILAHGGDPQRIVLIALRQRDDRTGHRGREQQRAAGLRCGVEDLFQILAEAHVQHLVRFVENDDLQGRQVERPTFEVIAQTSGRADHDLRSAAQVPALPGGIHAADAGCDLRIGGPVQPAEFAADLQREFAGGSDDQRQRRLHRRHASFAVQQLCRHGEAESNGLAAARLGGDDHVAAVGAVFKHGGLNVGRGLITFFGKGLGKDGGKFGKGHLDLLA